MVDLEIEHRYRVTELKRVNITHGDALTATINDEFFVYLPSRLSNALKVDNITFNKLLDYDKEDNLELIFFGDKWNSYKFGPQRKEVAQEKGEKEEGVKNGSGELKSIRATEPQQLSKLTKNLSKIDPEGIRLPDEWKLDKDFKMYRRCYEHYPQKKDENDGPVPFVKDCKK